MKKLLTVFLLLSLIINMSSCFALSDRPDSDAPNDTPSDGGYGGGSDDGYYDDSPSDGEYGGSHGEPSYGGGSYGDSSGGKPGGDFGGDENDGQSGKPSGGNKPLDEAYLIAGAPPAARVPYTEEGVTHEDPAIAEFISEHITFLSKVYPDGIPEHLEDSCGSLVLELVIDNPYLDALLELESDGNFDTFPPDVYIQADQYMSDIFSYYKGLQVFSQTAYTKITLDRILCYYKDYSEFESTGLRVLAELEENIPLEIYVYLESETESFGHICEIHRTPIDGEYSDSLIDGLKEGIDAMRSVTLLGDTEGAILSVGKAYSGSRLIIREHNPISFCTCSRLYSQRFALIPGEKLYPKDDGEYDYLVFLVNYTEGIDRVDVKSVAYEDGKISVHYTVPSDETFVNHGDAIIVIKLDRSKLSSPITEVQTRMERE